MSMKFAKLTRPAVRALKPGVSLSEHSIRAECMANGDIRWSINIMVDGQRIHRVVGRESEGVTREQAERLIEQLRTDARANRLNLPQGRKLHMTFSEASAKYIERMEQSGGRDLANKKNHLNQHLIPKLGTIRLDKLSNFELRKYRKSRLEAGASDATVNREFATLLHLLNRASSKDWGWMRADDKPEIPKVAEQRKARRALSQEQAEALMAGAKADQDPRCWLFVAIGLATGMRHSEIVMRRYDEIDWNSNRFEIGKAKAGARLQPFPEWLAVVLKAQQKMEDDPNGWLFPVKRAHAKTPYTPSMDAPFKRAVERAGLDPDRVTPHLMRHTIVTRLSKQFDARTIQGMSGHKSLSMVLHYVHANDEDIDLAANALAAPFGLAEAAETGTN